MATKQPYPGDDDYEPIPEQQKDVEDSITSSAASPEQPKQSPIPTLTKDDIDSARNDQRKYNALGAIADALANQQSFGNFMLGKMNPHVDAGAGFRGSAAQAGQRIADVGTLQNQALKAPELELTQQAMSKDSDYSKAKQAELSATISALAKFGVMDPQKASSLSSSVANLNGFQATKLLDGMKPMSDALRAQGMLAMTQRRLDQGDQRIATQKDQQAANAAKEFDTDTIMKDMIGRKQQIQRDKHTLESALQSGQPITIQMAAEMAKGVANALAGAKGSGLNEMAKQEYNTAEGTLASVQQYLTGKPTDALPDAGKKYLIDMFDRLDAAYDKTLSARANQMAIGKAYNHNPAAQQAIQDKVVAYGQPNPQPTGGGIIPSANADQAKDSKIDAYAKTYGMDYDTAKKLLESRGYGKR